MIRNIISINLDLAGLGVAGQQKSLNKNQLSPDIYQMLLVKLLVFF